MLKEVTANKFANALPELRPWKLFQVIERFVLILLCVLTVGVEEIIRVVTCSYSCYLNPEQRRDFSASALLLV